jgi:hypothetical protein
MKPEERDAVRRLANEVGGLRAFEHEIRAAIGHSNWACLMLRLAEADAALTAQSPAGVPPEPLDEGLAEFTAYFVKNYPGPDTIIGRPEWHAPKIFRAAQWAIRNAKPSAGVPTTEPVAPIAREPDSPARIKRLCAQAKVPKYMHDTDDGRAALVRFAQAYAAPQAPAEPVAQEPVALLPCPFCGGPACQPWGGDAVCCDTEDCAGRDAGASPSQWNRRTAP